MTSCIYMLLFSVAARVSKAESRRQNSWPRNPPVCCCWDYAVKSPRKRSGSSCGYVWGSKGSTGEQGAETTCEGQKGWFGTMAHFSVCADAPRIRTQPPALASTAATCHSREQVRGQRGAGAGVSGCCCAFKTEKLERLLYSKKMLKKMLKKIHTQINL